MVPPRVNHAPRTPAHASGASVRLEQVLAAVERDLAAGDARALLREQGPAWVRAAISLPAAAVRILAADRLDRLRSIVCDPPAAPSPPALRRSRRRALGSERTVVVPDRAPGSFAWFQRIVTPNEVVGLVEVHAERRPLPREAAALDAFATACAGPLERARASFRPLPASQQASRDVVPEQLELGLAWTAHEIRAPLSAAVAALDRALDGDVSATESEPLLRRARDELRVLSGSLHDVLRGSIAGAPLQRAPLDLRRVVEDVLASSALDGVEVEGASSVVVMGDAVQLRSAVSNLVRNASSYAASPRVTVSIGRHDADAYIEVRDDGPGVPFAERDEIFRPFARGSAGRVREGDGLGLFGARRIAESHGGTLRLESRGSGACFTIRIPAIARDVITSAS